MASAEGSQRLGAFGTSKSPMPGESPNAAAEIRARDLLRAWEAADPLGEVDRLVARALDRDVLASAVPLFERTICEREPCVLDSPLFQAVEGVAGPPSIRFVDAELEDYFVARALAREVQDVRRARARCRELAELAGPRLGRGKVLLMLAGEEAARGCRRPLEKAAIKVGWTRLGVDAVFRRAQPGR